ncbi:YqaJ viral recombinase family protein [Paenibacillus sp. UNC499MF]|uniref:YqaJ viral recombinase family nuclease n=1 Tax=Paenibacillus sp. UNC499MF TaxID=1502751 RepID=UPI00089FEB6D|nr:YqaJ viral recombinase family protein [Paenibacillus sp. UNC499MF]SEF87626.1 putative phage-type endonuclease [Paenibacillus sp. UNC499MF]
MRAKKLVNTRELSYGEWLAWRRQGIGGSDAAAVCGADKWKSALEVYLDKTGELPPAEEKEAMRLGSKLKDFIAREFTDRTGHRVMRRNSIFQHPEHSFMLAGLDRWVIGSQAGLLCKTAGEFSKEEWEEGRVPARIDFQCQHYMAVTGAGHWWVAVLIGGNKFRTVRLERSEERIEELIERETVFWNGHVLEKRPPAFDGTDASSDLLNRLYPPVTSRTSSVPLTEEAERWIGQYRQGAEEERAAALRKTEAENKLKGLLGEHEQGTVGNYKVEWKSINRKSARSASYRRFQISTISK